VTGPVRGEEGGSKTPSRSLHPTPYSTEREDILGSSPSSPDQC